MKVLLATGLSDIEEKVVSNLKSSDIECYRCYDNTTVLNVIKEYSANTVVFSPMIQGSEDLVETVITSLRQNGVRVVYLPGDMRDAKDAKELMKRLILLGIYCNVEPVNPESIIYRLQNPVKLANLNVAKAATGKNIKLISEALDASEVANKGNSILRLAGKTSTVLETIRTDDEEEEKGIKLDIGLAKKLFEKVFNNIKDSINKLELKQELVETTVNDTIVDTEPKLMPENLTYELLEKSVKTGFQANTLNACTVMAVCSPCASGGSSSFASILVRNLSENAKEKVSVFDCDLDGRGMGLRMGIKLIDMENRDWRKSGVPIEVFGANVYPLDPSFEDFISMDIMVESLQRASLGTNNLVIDLGSNMKSWWFHCGYELADVIFWVIRNDPLLLEKARLNWVIRPRARCREFLILLGEGNSCEMEEIFVLPCFQVIEKKGFKQVKTLLQGKLYKGRRVLVVGFKKVPDIDGLVCDVFTSAEEAIEWVKYNVPDVALLYEKLSKVSLLEYDLQKKEVLVKKITKDELVGVLQWLAQDQ